MSDSGYQKCPCKHCQGRIEFPAELAGSQIACPHCGAETDLYVPAPAKVAAVPVASAPVTTPEPVKSPWDEPELAEKTVRCPSCGAKAKPTDKDCPNCGATIKRNKLQLAFRIVGAVTILALLVVVGLTYLKKGPIGRRGATGPDLAVSPHTLKKETGANLIYVVGAVVNNSDNRYLALKIEFELLSSNGTVLGTTSDYLPILEPHKTWAYKAMVVDPDAINAKFLNFSAERHIEDPKVVEERKAAEKKKKDDDAKAKKK
jgi:predicted RNA-binding Zn-ribbon protein involved in translation (DUF1610 family)